MRRKTPSRYPATILIATLVICGGCDKIVSSSTERGPQWVLYTTTNSPLVSDTINAITIAGAGYIWIATANGANGLFGISWQNFQDTLKYTTPLGDSWNVNAVTVAKNGTVWFGLAGGGVKVYNSANSKGDRWRAYQTPVLSSNFVYSLAADGVAGDVWISTSNGATRYIANPSDPDLGTWIKYSSFNSPLSNSPIRSSGVNPLDKMIWLGTQRDGAASFDGDQLWNIDAPTDSPFPIISMAFTHSTTIWFGTFANWAYRYSTISSEWEQVGDSAHGGGLPDPFVNALAVDKRGVVWFGTNKGLTRYDGATWNTLTSSNSSLPNDTIRALAVDPRNNLWIGTLHGLVQYNEEGTLR